MDMDMEGDICGFCLGGEEDIPPFGTIADAKDLVRPCSVCQLTAHRKCLFDWFNSLPPDKLTTTSVVDDLSDYEELESDSDSDNDVEEFNGDVPQTSEPDADDIEQALPQPTTFNITILFGALSSWISNFVQEVRDLREMDGDGAVAAGNHTNSNNDPYLNRNDENYLQYHHIDHHHRSALRTVHLSAACPQCRNNITFKMKHSGFLTLNTILRGATIGAVQYGGLFLGLTGAATGIVTLSYVGLAKTGMNILECLIPSPLLVSMLSRRNTQTLGSLRSFFPISKQSFNTLEEIISKGFIDQFKFSHIPILPIVLYRMRTSSLVSCFTKNGDPQARANGWITEFMISNFFSSLGSHKLLRQLLSNISLVIRNGSLASLTSNIDIWDPNTMIGLLVPTRWLYDALFRLTFNRGHFNIASSIRPRDIVNHASQGSIISMEYIHNEIVITEEMLARKAKLAEAKYPITPSMSVITSVYRFLRQKLLYYKLCTEIDRDTLLAGHRLLPKYIKDRFAAWYQTTKACFMTDYSATVFHKSLSVRGVTTLLWPFLSSDMGRILHRFVFNEGNFKGLAGVPSDRVRMMSNMIGLVLVVLAKDWVNLWLSSRKAGQISKMTIVKKKKKPRRIRRDSIPGGFH